MNSSHKDHTTPRLKKQLGQHFLHDESIAQSIVALVNTKKSYSGIVEIGPGAGALTSWLVQAVKDPLYLIEVDKDLIPKLEAQYTSQQVSVVHADFLRWPLSKTIEGPTALIGNLPYNISSQIFFKVLEYREQVEEVICMIQHEVAERITTPAGHRKCGILSILMQAFYETTYCFPVPASAFTPPPKVTSAVIHLTRKQERHLPCDEKLFFSVVKNAFQQRRKMLRNALAPLGIPLEQVPEGWLTKRAEALSVEDFVQLTSCLSQQS